MPSTHKTDNYGLNQWAGDDRPIRTDFNDDNLKIDGALKSLKDRDDQLTANKAESGYCKLPNGIIMQWGVAEITPSTADVAKSVTVTLPTQFSSALSYQCTATARSSAPYTGVREVCINNPTTTTIDIVLTRSDIYITRISWIAIGY